VVSSGAQAATPARAHALPALAGDATLPAACGTIAAAAIRRSATTEEIVDLLGGCADSPAARRTNALIFVLWRSGLRIRQALALEERDLDPVVGSLTRRGKRRIAGMDPWDGRRSPTGLQPSRGFDSLQSWIESIAWASTRASSFVNAVFVSRLNAWLFCGRSRMNHT
jgi:site-specific recombinase XerC